MSPQLLREAGEALYGPRWQSDLSRDLNVSDRTMRRWAAGEWDVPQTAQAELRTLLSARRASIADVLEVIDVLPR